MSVTGPKLTLELNELARSFGSMIEEITIPMRAPTPATWSFFQENSGVTSV